MIELADKAIAEAQRKENEKPNATKWRTPTLDVQNAPCQVGRDHLMHQLVQ